MKEFLMMYWTWVVGIAVVIIALAILWYFKKVPLVKRILYAMVCEAEKQFGSGTGEIKYATVIYMFYYRMPVFVRVVFTPARISGWIEAAVTQLKSELSDGMTLLGSGEGASTYVTTGVSTLPPIVTVNVGAPVATELPTVDTTVKKVPVK